MKGEARSVSRNRAAATIGPMVWDEEGPIPTLNISKTDRNMGVCLKWPNPRDVGPNACAVQSECDAFRAYAAATVLPHCCATKDPTGGRFRSV